MAISVKRDEPSYFAYSATLRIHGAVLPFDEISRTLAVASSYQHRAGKRRQAAARPYAEDAWHFTAPVAPGRELTEHLRCLWRIVEPHVQYLALLRGRVDVFCGYRSNDGSAGFSVEPDALQIFTALNVPFGVSVIVDGLLGAVLPAPTEH